MDLNMDSTDEQRTKSFLEEFQALVKAYNIEVVILGVRTQEHSVASMRVGHPIEFMRLLREVKQAHKEAFEEAMEGSIKEGDANKTAEMLMEILTEALDAKKNKK